MSYLWKKLLLINIEVINSVEFQGGNLMGVTESIHNIAQWIKSLSFKAVANP